MNLFPDPVPPPIDGIDLRCCDVAECFDDAKGARLVIADPPWGEYQNKPGQAHPEESYPVLELAQVVAHLDAAHDAAAPGARLALWTVWPLMMADGHIAEIRATGWKPKSGGAWHKLDHCGVGYHWRGNSEPVLLFRKSGKPHTDRTAWLDNGWSESPGQHSAKPIAWMRAWLRRWTAPGDLVFDMYAGTAAVGVACMLEGRRYLGAEIDETRHARALGLLARARALAQAAPG